MTDFSRLGLSSACFYPEETFDAVNRCVELGFKNVEIFMNSFTELEKPYLKRLAKFCRERSVKVTSIHPFTSGYEYMLFFSAYKKRAAEAAEAYKKYFRAAAYLEADYVVFHGDSLKAPFIGLESYCENLAVLCEAARSEGVVLAHENVSSARAGNPDFIRGLRKAFGENVLSFVFDVKQATRGEYDPFDMISAMGSDIKHVHINDWEDGECRLPYAGSLDINSIISRIEANGYKGKYIIEVYRKNFDNFSEIVASGNRLSR